MSSVVGVRREHLRAEIAWLEGRLEASRAALAALPEKDPQVDPWDTLSSMDRQTLSEVCLSEPISCVAELIRASHDKPAYQAMAMRLYRLRDQGIIIKTARGWVAVDDWRSVASMHAM